MPFIMTEEHQMYEQFKTNIELYEEITVILIL